MYCCAGGSGASSSSPWLLGQHGRRGELDAADGDEPPVVTYRGYCLAMAVDPSSPGDGANDVVYVGTRPGRDGELRRSFTGIGGSTDTTPGRSRQRFGNPPIVLCGTDGGLMRPHRGGTGRRSAPAASRPRCSTTSTANPARRRPMIDAAGRRPAGRRWQARRRDRGRRQLGRRLRHRHERPRLRRDQRRRLLSTDDGRPGAGRHAVDRLEASGNYSHSPSTRRTPASSTSPATRTSGTRDATATWTAIAAPGAAGVVSVAPSDGNFVVVTSGSQVFVSQNA